MSHTYLKAADFGSPSRRLRLYAVLTLRRHISLSRSVGEIKDVLGSSSEDCLCSEDLTFETASPLSLPPSAIRYKRSYEKTYGFEAGYYDLSQNPSFCARACRSEDPLFTLTTNCGHIWSISEKRCLSGNEVAAAQGLPSHPGLASALGTPFLDFNSYKRSVWGRMIGNGMSTACVSAVLAWVASFAIPSCGDIPRAPTSAQCGVHLAASDTGYTASPTTAACTLGTLEPVACNPSPCDVPAVGNAHAGGVCGMEATAIADGQSCTVVCDTPQDFSYRTVGFPVLPQRRPDSPVREILGLRGQSMSMPSGMMMRMTLLGLLWAASANTFVIHPQLPTCMRL